MCDWQHRWYVESQQQVYHGRVGNVFTTAQIAESGVEFKGGQKKHFVPMMRPVQFKPCDQTIDPYTLGVLLGDGCLTGNTYRMNLSAAEREQMEVMI